MKLVDYLSLILKKHGEVLLALRGRFTESILVEMLERQGKIAVEPLVPELEALEVSSYESFPYEVLEQTVKSLKLPTTLDFYIWSYPYYRSFIESPLKLEQKLLTLESALLQKLTQDAILFAEAWALAIPAQEPFKTEIVKLVQEPWKFFEKDVNVFLKRSKLKLV